MRFYSLRQSYEDGNVNFLNIENLHILIGASLSASKLIHYLPNFGHFQDDDEIFNTEILKKKAQENKMAIEVEKKEENEYYMKLRGRHYIKKEIKFDISSYENIDLSQVDYILLTNLENLLALPYLTEYTKFKGKVYATLPIVQISLYLLIEFQELVELRNKKDFIIKKDFFEESHFLELFESEGLHVSTWLSIYNKQAIKDSFSKIQPINYGEIIELSDSLTLEAVSSGFSIGSSNFIFKTKTKKIVYLSNSSLSQSRHCSSINLESIQDPDILIVEDIANRNNVDLSKNWKFPDLRNYDILLQNFVEYLLSHLNNRDSGNILLPVRNSIFLLDLIDLFRRKVHNFQKIHIIGTSFEEIVAYSNANVEFVNSILNQKIYSDNPEVPFNHTDLVKNGKLVYYKSIDEFQQRASQFSHQILDTGFPSLYIISDSSFRIGHAAKMLELFDKTPKGIPALFLTDPHTQDIAWMHAFSLKKVQIIRCPLDPNLTISELSELIFKINPGTLIVPRSYEKNNPNNLPFSLQIPQNTRILEYKEDDEIDINIPQGSITTKALFEDKGFEEMKKFELPKLRLYFIEGVVEKDSKGEYVARIRESNESSQDKKNISPTYLLTLEKSDVACDILVKEMEGKGFQTQSIGRDIKGMNGDIVFRVTFHKGDRIIVVTHELNQTKIFFSRNFETEEKEEIEKVVINSLSLTKLIK